MDWAAWPLQPILHLLVQSPLRRGLPGGMFDSWLPNKTSGRLHCDITGLHSAALPLEHRGCANP
eukprot:11277940-Alexandrium_andersonii.AAC.1